MKKITPPFASVYSDLQTSLSRRQWLLGSAATVATLPAWARAVHAADASKLRLASVGVGGMGANDLRSLSSHPSVEVVALCDVDAKRLKAAGELHPKAKLYADYRLMLNDLHDTIDAVQVSTPDHTHAPATVTAMNHGKHVYCQKPLTHDVYEARQMRLIAAEKGVTSQMGTQIHSKSEYRTAVKLVQSGVIGKVREVYSWSEKAWGYDGPTPETAAVPDFLNWDLWLGTAPVRDYAEQQYHPFRWRQWVDFGCGTMGDMAIHILDPVFSALKLTAPLSITSASDSPPQQSFSLQNQVNYRFAATDYTTDDFRLTWTDGGRMPNTDSWPTPTDKNGKPTSIPRQGSLFFGEKGSILLPHVGFPSLLPEADFATHDIRQAIDGNHYHLFVDACLGGEPTTAGFDYAGPLTEAVLLGVLANRFPKQEMLWDPKAMKITNFAPVNELLRRKYRDGFDVSGL